MRELLFNRLNLFLLLILRFTLHQKNIFSFTLQIKNYNIKFETSKFHDFSI